MRQKLPFLSRSVGGFTLIELLITIAIIAIITTVGIVIYGDTQKKARDAKRRADLDAIAKALEVNKGATSYIPLADSQFGNSIPGPDPKGWAYCIAAGTTPGALPTPAVWTTATCVLPFVDSKNTVPPLPIVTGTVVWKVCASMETATPAVECRSNQQ